MAIAVLFFGGDSLIQLAFQRRWAKQDKKSDLVERIETAEKQISEQGEKIDKINETLEDLQDAIALITKTQKVLAFDMLFNRLTYFTDIKGYATVNDRNSIKPYEEIYKEHNWNGDIKEQMKKFNALPSMEKEDEEWK